MSAIKLVRVRGALVPDQVFTFNWKGEEINWNVTKLIQSAKLGIFGKPKVYKVADLPPPIYDNVERPKIEAIKNSAQALNTPAIAIGSNPSMSSKDMLCFADGNHRIIARQELKLLDFKVYIVPWDLEDQYRVTFDVVDLQ